MAELPPPKVGMWLKRRITPLHLFILLSLSVLFACRWGMMVLNACGGWGMLLLPSLKYPQGQSSFSLLQSLNQALSNRIVSMSFEKTHFYYLDIKALVYENSSLTMPGK